MPTIGSLSKTVNPYIGLSLDGLSVWCVSLGHLLSSDEKVSFIEVSAFASLRILGPWHTTEIADFCTATTATHVISN